MGDKGICKICLGWFIFKNIFYVLESILYSKVSK